MLAPLRTRLSYANVIATIALFVALGGTGYAAAKIGSAQIKNNSVQSKDVKNRTLLARDFKAGQLPAGRTGPTGPTGATGPAGSPAASFLTGRFQEENGYDGFAAASGTSTLTSTESDVTTLSPARTVVARDLVVRSTTSNRAPKSYILRVNGADTALKCTIAPPPPDGTPSSCSDTTHVVSIPPGSLIALRNDFNVSGGTGGGPVARFAWRATAP